MSPTGVLDVEPPAALPIAHPPRRPGYHSHRVRRALHPRRSTHAARSPLERPAAPRARATLPDLGPFGALDDGAVGGGGVRVGAADPGEDLTIRRQGPPAPRGVDHLCRGPVRRLLQRVSARTAPRAQALSVPRPLRRRMGIERRRARQRHDCGAAKTAPHRWHFGASDDPPRNPSGRGNRPDSAPLDRQKNPTHNQGGDHGCSPQREVTHVG